MDKNIEKQLNFERFERLVGQEGMQTLKEKSVFILGIGGVGGYLCEALARSGVGHIILMDGDVIDETNINRQIIALYSTVGLAKVDVMKERILDINPKCDVETINCFLEDDLSILKEFSFDYFIDCCDDVRVKKALLSYFDERKDFLCCLGTAKKLDPSKLEITKLDKTYNDPLARIMRSKFDKRVQKKITVCTSIELPLKVIDKSFVGSTAFVPSSAGLLIASYVVRKLI